MGQTTNITWTDHTFNPWWGCQRVSPGCENCYAETMAKRWGHDIWGPAKTTERRLFGDAHWHEPIAWDLAAAEARTRKRVFCASMADVFEDHPLVIPSRYRLWSLIEQTPNLDWLLLTKRPENIAHMLPGGRWPNVWLGTSAETQQYAEQRIPVLLEHRERVPVLFVSAEPLLGSLDLRWCLEDCEGFIVNWVIVGGESGPRHRPLDLGWARTLRDQCQAAGTAFFFKQVGGRTHAEGGDLLDGREHKEFPQPAREAVHA